MSRKNGIDSSMNVDAETAPAQRVLYDHLFARVHLLATRLVGSNEADDVTQNVFLQRFCNLGQDRKEAKFETWLYRLTINEALQYRRRRKRWTMTSLREEQAPVSSRGGSSYDEREILDRALAP